MIIPKLEEFLKKHNINVDNVSDCFISEYVDKYDAEPNEDGHYEDIEDNHYLSVQFGPRNQGVVDEYHVGDDEDLQHLPNYILYKQHKDYVVGGAWSLGSRWEGFREEVVGLKDRNEQIAKYRLTDPLEIVERVYQTTDSKSEPKSPPRDMLFEQPVDPFTDSPEFGISIYFNGQYFVHQWSRIVEENLEKGGFNSLVINDWVYNGIYATNGKEVRQPTSQVLELS